jgi:tetratricopeptide (TPR) repeat protein
MVDGRPQAGRYISEAAYALFGRGAEAEAAGDFPNALRAFSMAADEDPESPEIWLRLGALRCRMAPPAAPPPAEAMADFERAEHADPNYGPVHRERARCLAAHGQLDRAAAASERAVALDPDDASASILRAEVLEHNGAPKDAARVLRALLARRPRLVEGWTALLDLGKRTHDAALAAEAAAKLAALSPDRAAALQAEVPAIAPLAAVDAALRGGDLEAARRVAQKARIPWSEVAVRAALLGRPALAREQAELVLGADPRDASARIALAAAADLAGDPAAIAAALRMVPARSTAPSPLARILFAEVLARRVSVEAARAWLGAAPEAAGGDPLLAEAAARLRARLDGARVTAQ